MLELTDLGILLLGLAVAAVAAQRLAVSAIPLFVIVGIALGPHAAGIVEESEGVEALASVGLVLLLFLVGLELSFDRIVQARRFFLRGGSIDLLLSAGAGLAIGFALTGPSAEAVLLAGVVAISSTGVITRALFDLRRLADDESDLILAILVFEDLAVAAFLGFAAALAAGEAIGSPSVWLTGVGAMAFVVVMLAASRVVRPVVDRHAHRLSREQLLLAVLAVAIGFAGIGELVGVSEAVGALLAGVLLSDTEVRDEIERQLVPLRDFAAAVFFLGFGLAVDLAAADEVLVWLVVAVPIAIGAKLVAGYLAARAAGFGVVGGLDVGTALVARGEFSLVIAQVAVTGGALSAQVSGRIEVFAGLLVVATSLAGVLLMRESRRMGRWLEPRLRRAGTKREGDARHS